MITKSDDSSHSASGASSNPAYTRQKLTELLKERQRFESTLSRQTPTNVGASMKKIDLSTLK
jgi:hypothetical protein